MSSKKGIRRIVGLGFKAVRCGIEGLGILGC